MDQPIESKHPALQPLTFGGVAAFARGPLSSLFLAEMAVAVLVAVSFSWFVAVAWVPAIQEALDRLPENASVRHGTLVWNSQSPATLGRTPFLAIIVDMEEASQAGQAVDLQWEFGRTGIKVRSLLGYLGVRYPSDWVIVVNRIDWTSWWGAWRPFVLTATGITVIAGLFFCWSLLAALYAMPLRWLAILLGRELSWSGSWRMASAALMPGAVWMSAAILLYGLRQLDLVKFMCAFGLHLLIGWFYLIISPTLLPALPSAVENPFSSPSSK